MPYAKPGIIKVTISGATGGYNGTYELPWVEANSQYELEDNDLTFSISGQISTVTIYAGAGGTDEISATSSTSGRTLTIDGYSEKIGAFAAATITLVGVFWPIVEWIIRSVVDDLGNVTTANNCRLTLAPVRPKPRLGNNLVNGSAVVFLGTATRQEASMQYEQWLQNIIIHYKVVADDDDETAEPIDTMLANVGYDIVYALCKDQSTRRRDDWAVTTELVSIDPVVPRGDANEAAAEVEISVQYRHMYGDPMLHPSRTP